MESMEKRYIVPEGMLRQLLEAEEKLCRLESAGVDNWDGYSYAFSEEMDAIYGDWSVDETLSHMIWYDSDKYTSADIGIRLRNERIKNGYTIERLAKLLTVREDTIQAWEDSFALPADRYVAALSTLYGVSENYLLGLRD